MYGENVGAAADLCASAIFNRLGSSGYRFRQFQKNSYGLH